MDKEKEMSLHPCTVSIKKLLLLDIILKKEKEKSTANLEN